MITLSLIEFFETAGCGILTKISEFEHIRRAVAKYNAKQKTAIAEKDPIREIIGLCDDERIALGCLTGKKVDFKRRM